MDAAQLPLGEYVVAVCIRCRGCRYPTRALTIEKAGDIPLDRIEPRLRCVARNGDKRGPACGGAMHIELAAQRTVDPQWAHR